MWRTNFVLAKWMFFTVSVVVWPFVPVTATCFVPQPAAASAATISTATSANRATADCLSLDTGRLTTGPGYRLPLMCGWKKVLPCR